MLFRLMTKGDLENVLKNERQTYSHPWSEKVFLDCIAGTSECWVLETTEGIISHLIITSVLDEGHILNLCVGRDCQGKGYAHKVLAHAIRRLQALRAEAVFLEVRASNKKAISLYLRHGFTQIGYRKDYYPLGSVREDAVVMSRKIAVDCNA